MPRSLNKVMLIGNVGRNPELKFTPSGIPVTSFRMATTETWKDRDGNLQEHTDWHTVVAWRGLAEVIHKLVKKGSRVFIEGRIQTRSFEDKNGNRKHVVEILADNMLLIEGRKQKEENEPEDNKQNVFDDLDDMNISYDSDFEKRISMEDQKDKEIPF